MRKTKIIDIDDKKITVKELTAADIRGLMEDTEKQKEPGIIDLLFPDMPARAFELCTDLSEKEIEALLQSDLIKIKEAIVTLNPLLASLTKRLLKAMEAQAQKA